MHTAGRVAVVAGPHLDGAEVPLEVLVLDVDVGGAEPRAARGAAERAVRVAVGARHVAHQLVVREVHGHEGGVLRAGPERRAGAHVHEHVGRALRHGVQSSARRELPVHQLALLQST